MIKYYRLTLTALLALAVCMPLQADSVRMGTFTIPLMVESATRGVFIRLAEAVAAEAGEELVISLFPTRRVREVFAEQNLDVIFPAIDLSMNSPYLATTAVYSKRVFAFTRVTEPLVTRVEDMTGKRIGYTSVIPAMFYRCQAPIIKALLPTRRASKNYWLVVLMYLLAMKSQLCERSVRRMPAIWCITMRPAHSALIRCFLPSSQQHEVPSCAAGLMRRSAEWLRMVGWRLF